MKTIAKIIESMLTKDATQQWDTKVISQMGATSTWGWGGCSTEDSIPSA